MPRQAGNKNSHPAIEYGEIIGDFNSPDGKVVGATLPGKLVSFSVPQREGKTQYLHFAMMHAASAARGWYFAPKSADGIPLTGPEATKQTTTDITDQIALFRAPDAQTSAPVGGDDDKLKYGDARKFMSASLTHDHGMFVVSIRNISAGEYQTPFSSGVWAVTDKPEKSFDHQPSAALSTLATRGHRGPLYQSVKAQCHHP